MAMPKKVNMNLFGLTMFYAFYRKLIKKTKTKISVGIRYKMNLLDKFSLVINFL